MADESKDLSQDQSNTPSIPAHLVPPVDAPWDDLIKGSLPLPDATRGVFPPATAVGGAGWVSQGPGPILNGQVENIIPNDEVSGAVHALAAHPTNPNILYLGSVNGGVWKTINATAVNPTWIPLTDLHSSLSITSLEFDPTDATHQTLLAGIGRVSSFGVAGDFIGVLRTTDGGTTWIQLDGGGLLSGFTTGISVTGVAPRGSTLVVTAKRSFVTGGVYRSTDSGASFTLISGTNGLPSGPVFDMVGDPGNPSRLYAAVEDTGIFRSEDMGLTWTDVTGPAIASVITFGNNNRKWPSMITG